MHADTSASHATDTFANKRESNELDTLRLAVAVEQAEQAEVHLHNQNICLRFGRDLVFVKKLHELSVTTRTLRFELEDGFSFVADGAPVGRAAIVAHVHHGVADGWVTYIGHA